MARTYIFRKGRTYPYLNIFVKAIRAYEDKFPFRISRQVIKQLVIAGILERYRTRLGTIRYRPTQDFALPIEIKLAKWLELNYTYTFVASKPARIENIKVEGKDTQKKIERRIETNFISIAPGIDLEVIQDKISRAVEYAIRDNKYGFIYDEPNIGAGDSWKISEIKKPEKFLGKFRCFDHTYNRVKEDTTFELPQDWWELSADEIGELLARNIKFELLR